jgi:hypothetical protein
MSLSLRKLKRCAGLLAVESVDKIDKNEPIYYICGLILDYLKWTCFGKQVPGNADHGQLPQTISDLDL